MIVYTPFWQTLEASTESTYSLINKHGISSNTLSRMRKGLPLSTVTINDFCRIFNCSVGDIVEYIPNDDDQLL
ncbi:helix-turn-helix domain-containing protein [Lacrimispora sp. NSJ-141]|uniref:Helix-turn-helix domain-containing protein n=2 Tax=Lachnospiraceae TaxID=186803 RepID=A0A7G9G197_9FIRM|nr:MULTISPECIES: helix-turn-helix domain-containing protein [Lachnospiraceae]MCD2493482.1 helix-turn-helix domain-containing protein [Lientehia hominis]QNM04579.1 helix-turn-helix domain-containing protein [Qiania dongpingensis]